MFDCRTAMHRLDLTRRRLAKHHRRRIISASKAILPVLFDLTTRIRFIGISARGLEDCSRAKGYTRVKSFGCSNWKGQLGQMSHIVGAIGSDCVRQLANLLDFNARLAFASTCASGPAWVNPGRNPGRRTLTTLQPR